MEPDEMKTNTRRLLERAKGMCTPATQYQLAKRLQIAEATVTRCMRHRGTLDNTAVMKLSELLGQPFDELLALVEIDRAKTPKQRGFWERYAPDYYRRLLLRASWRRG